MFLFIILNASSKEDFECLLESVNQWYTQSTYHYLNKATTTIISASNIAITIIEGVITVEGTITGND